MRNRIEEEFNKMPIARKVMLLYGWLFTLSIVAFSVVLLISAKGMGVGITFTTLQNCAESIENYILSGKELNNDSIESIVGSNYVEYIIENKTQKKVYVSTNFIPDSNPEAYPDNEMSLSPDIEDDLNLKQKKVDHGYFRILDNNDYTVYTKNGHDFISIQNEFMCGGNIYSIKLFKAAVNNMFYVKYLAMRLLYVDIIGLLFAALIGMYISRVMLRPVRKIRETAERISVEDLSQRIEISGPDDELKELSITFNSMIDRLEQSFEQQSRFVSDASHELRTPISVIKGYANLINRWGKDDPEILQEAVNNILEETDHMSVMIKNLLFLAKSDQHRNHVQKQPMSLNDAVADIAKDLSVTDEKIKVTVDLNDEDIIINGDPDLIKQMLWIYTENAMKYSGDDKEIAYRVYREANFACVSVRDNGYGINEEDLPHIFDRFYRVDKSRNKDIPGNGLGLSIAKWIIEIHSGKVEVKSIVGQGTEFINKFKIE